MRAEWEVKMGQAIIVTPQKKMFLMFVGLLVFVYNICVNFTFLVCIIIVFYLGFIMFFMRKCCGFYAAGYPN